MGALRDRMIEEMKLRNFSAATQKTYVYAVTRLVKYHGKAPDQLSKEEIRAFLVHLIVERKLSPNGLTGYCSGLRFFYNETLRWDEKQAVHSTAQAIVTSGGGLQCRGNRTSDPRGPRSQAACANDRLLGWTASQRVSQSQDQRHRSGAHDASYQARQRRQRPLRDFVAEPPC